MPTYDTTEKILMESVQKDGGILRVVYSESKMKAGTSKSGVHIRRYYTADDGQVYPTKKGVFLTPETLELVKECLNKLTIA